MSFEQLFCIYDIYFCRRSAVICLLLYLNILTQDQIEKFEQPEHIELLKHTYQIEKLDQTDQIEKLEQLDQLEQTDQIEKLEQIKLKSVII